LKPSVNIAVDINQ